MSDYRNLSIPLADGGIDGNNPPDKIVPGKYAVLTNVYPQGLNVLSQRKGFSSFYDQGDTMGDMQSIFPITSTVALFATDAGGGTVGITDSAVPSHTSLSTGWGSSPPTFVSAQVPFTDIGAAFLPFVYPPPIGFTLATQNWVYGASGSKLQKFAYPPIDSSASLFSTASWGLSPPLDTPTVALAGSAGGQDSSVSGAEPYTYCYTFFSNLTGAESIPSPVSAEINSTLQAIQINMLGYAGPFDIQYDALRIYRKGGTQVSVFRLVATISATSVTYVDNQSDDSISTSPVLQEDNDRPFVTSNLNGDFVPGTPLPYIWGPFVGQYIMACGDTVSPGSVFWTNAGRPDTMDSSNNLQVTGPSEPLQNGFIYGGNSFVWSQLRLFALDYGGPDAIPTFVPREIPIGMGLAAPYAFAVSSLGGVFFLGNDGIYVTDCNSQIVSITNDSIRPIFRGETGGTLTPVNYLDASGNPSKELRMFASGQEIHFLYRDIFDIKRHLVYNILLKTWRVFELAQLKHATCGVALGNGENAFLVGTDDEGITDHHTRILEYNNSSAAQSDTDYGNAYEISFFTGGYDMEIPETLKEFGNVIIDINTAGNNVTVQPIYDGLTFGPIQTINTVFRERVPVSLNDTYAYFVQLLFTWSSQSATVSYVKCYNLEWLFRSDQEVLKHWEVPPAAFGMAGWQHIRDGYFTLRSTADITLTISVDNVDYTYTIPSTGGEKKKVYMKFRPVKGKMFGFSLDSTGGFRLYGEDTQLNIKPWNTDFGYKPIYPFTAPGYAPYLRNEAGT